ncbi:divalent-cation tolerance protein CutA [Dokdonella sp.]|uniref:divalent-cation tolerance protein CutA n=1 Tax=Dokdonella sp. TaxID=2291710 RepID=UPI003C561D72
MSILIVHCSCPDSAVATAIAHALVSERLAACVSRLAGAVSTYQWNDGICVDDEVLLLIKTTVIGFQALKTRLLELHPYELPEIIAVDVSVAHADYIDWVESQVGVP